jgi:glycosyltransferase involved in cell wall biosynthesis
MNSRHIPTLVIVIPALNEEQSIGSIIERTLIAKTEILSTTRVDEVKIVVVSDGSTDRTLEIAEGYADSIEIIAFPDNRGYGAAILAGWERYGESQLLGFLDADGTCNPKFFVDLVRAIDATNSDVVLGCRIHKASKMTATRWLGNVFFAKMLSFLAGVSITDSASGMRVLKRTALDKLMPLPSGLNFTPAMSAEALFLPNLKLVEIEMPYGEREGRSKLSVTRDGLRFLRTIIGAGARYAPQRVLDGFSLVFAAFAAVFFALSSLIYAGGLESSIFLSLLVLAQTLWLSAVSLACGGEFVFLSSEDRTPVARPLLGRFLKAIGFGKILGTVSGLFALVVSWRLFQIFEGFERVGILACLFTVLLTLLQIALASVIVTQASRK